MPRRGCCTRIPHPRPAYGTRWRCTHRSCDWPRGTSRQRPSPFLRARWCWHPQLASGVLRHLSRRECPSRGVSHPRGGMGDRRSRLKHVSCEISFRVNERVQPRFNIIYKFICVKYWLPVLHFFQTFQNLHMFETHKNCPYGRVTIGAHTSPFAAYPLAMPELVPSGRSETQLAFAF